MPCILGRPNSFVCMDGGLFSFFFFINFFINQENMNGPSWRSIPDSGADHLGLKPFPF